MAITPPAGLRFTPCQTKALDILHREGNVFLTGAAGTGKSFLLEQFIRDKLPMEFPIVASTGAAAVLVGGRTFHSFFGLGILEGGPAAAVARALRNGKVVHRMQRAFCVIIDEISMLSGDTLQAAEMVARRARGGDQPWGGLRVIAVGDFAQLPPINPENTDKDWAFRHPVWRESDFQPALLTTVMRTQDLRFLEILNKVREGIVDSAVESFLDEHTIASSDHAEGTRLYPHRAQADQFNHRKLDALTGRLHSFATRYDGADEAIERAKRQFPIPEELLLKEGALIMMRKNDASGGYQWVNGSLGIVRAITRETLSIDLLSGDSIDVSEEKFSSLDGDGNELAAAWNFPVTLAWATTIHKSQGASLDRMIVDLERLWEPGQAYVALSRVRSGAGLTIERWHPSSIRAEPLVTAFYDGLSDQARKYVPRPLFQPVASVSVAPTPTPPRRKAGSVRLEREQTIAFLISEQVPLEEIARHCKIKEQRVLLYLERLAESGVPLDLQYLTRHLPDRSAIRAAFREYGTDTLAPVFQALDGIVPYDTLRLVRLQMVIEENR